MSNNAKRLDYAIRVGYRVVGNEVWHPRGSKPVKLIANTCGYLRFTIQNRSLGLKGVVLVHRLAAWQKFGAEMLKPGIVVRHLDGNSRNNDFSNLALGTHSDNMMDRLETDRVSHARKAARTRRKLTDQQVTRLRKDHDNGAAYVQLAEKYGIAKSTVSYIINKRTYS